MPTPETDLEFASTEDEAIDRAKMFKRLDPFPEILPALLSSADIEDYARITAMLFPFRRDPGALKPASYEVRPGHKFVWWRDNGERVDEDISEDGTYELPPNSIRYMQIAPTVRLPDYIAIRFNLRIKHVHRGLLLGTGPLIDPGFGGNILIPLRNLTSESHRIRGNEGLIWIEFTKTAARVSKAEPSYVRRGKLHPMEEHKTDVSIDAYFQRANEGKPIRSSIPEATRNAEAKAEQAERSATRASELAGQSAQSLRNTGRLITGIGFVAILALSITLHQYFAQIYSNFQTTVDLANTVNTNADQARADANRAITEAQTTRRDLEAQIEVLRGQLGTVTHELERLRQPVPPRVSPSSG